MHVTAIGRTEILTNTIRAIRSAGHSIDRIVTSDAEEFYSVTASDFERLAGEIGADYHYERHVDSQEMIDILEDSPSEVAVSVNWMYPITRPVLDSFEHGILNGHAGDLPRYRGNAAPNWAIINGEDEIVLTVHQMSEEIDAGPILSQSSLPLSEDTYLGDVYKEMRLRFPDLFVEAVSGLADGSITPRPQSNDPSEILRGYPRIPKDSEIDWTRPAPTIHRLIRASAEPLFGAFTYLETTKLTIWRARVAHPSFDYVGTPGQVADRRTDAGEVAVLTGDGHLILEEVEIEGGGRGPATDVITSTRTRLGMDPQAVIRELETRVTALEERLDDR